MREDRRSVGETGCVVKVDGSVAAMYDQTNFLGGVRLAPGSNAISVVTRSAGGAGTNETVLAVHMPPTNPQRCSYDLNGNMSADGYRVFTWNDEDRLIAIETDTNYPGLLRRRSEFLYDGAGRMFRRTDWSTWTNGTYAVSNVTWYIRDGYRVLAEIAVGATNFNVWGLDLSQTLDAAGGIGGLLACRGVAEGEAGLFFYDGNGNVTDLVDANGFSVAHYEFDPFGRIVAQPGPASTNNPWRFSTKQYDPWWGLVHYEFRVYSPEIGRWLSRDPAGEAGGENVCAFVVNDPVSLVDPLGLIWTVDWLNGAES